MRKTGVLLAAVALGSFAVGRSIHDVQAQGAPTLVATTGNGYFAVDSAGRVFRVRAGAPWEVIGQLPSGTPVSLDMAICCTGFLVGMANGDMFYTVNDPSRSNPLQFGYRGNVFGGPIAVEGKSLSDVKDSYRK